MLAVGIFKTEEEAIKLANDTSYGLGAGLHSSMTICCRLPDPVSQQRPADDTYFIDDANQCMRVASALEAGTV